MCLEAKDIVGCLGKAYTVIVGLHYLVHLRKQSVCLFRCGFEGFLCAFALRQVGNHDGGIKASFLHLGQINEDLIGAAAEHLYVLLAVACEEHGSIAVTV